MKTLAAVKIPADNTVAMSVVDISADPSKTLPSMYPIIGCNIVQPMPVASVNDSLLWCDEEALCKADPVLNVRASMLAGTPIFGDAILAGDDGETVVTLQMNCPKAFFEYLQGEADTFVKKNGNLKADEIFG